MVTIQERELWVLNLQLGSESIIGHEQGRTRPCVVIKVLPRLKMATIIPLTSNIGVSRFPYTHEIQPTKQNGLSRTNIAMIFQVRSVSFNRFKNNLGDLENIDFTEIKDLISDFFFQP
ncbi:MAG: type II toxin-antitoxin system PemK/MazF family toxin [Promethearchaeota archaeon]